MIGLYGKLPAHGDFVRRLLPPSFVQPWDAWLQAGIIAAREALSDDFFEVWGTARPWRFCLPAGACGDMNVAGVLIPSQDRAGRLFPLTLAQADSSAAAQASDEWYEAVESAGCIGRDRGDTADALLTTLNADIDGTASSASGAVASAGWWQANGQLWDLPELPQAVEFVILLKGGA